MPNARQSGANELKGFHRLATVVATDTPSAGGSYKRITDAFGDLQ